MNADRSWAAFVVIIIVVRVELCVCVCVKEQTKRIFSREMSIDKKHRLVSLIWDSMRKSIDACRNYSSISQLVLRLIFAALLASCVLLIFILVSHLSMNKRKIDDENRMLVCSFFRRSRSIDRSIDPRTSFSDSFSHLHERILMPVSKKQRQKAKSIIQTQT